MTRRPRPAPRSSPIAEAVELRIRAMGAHGDGLGEAGDRGEGREIMVPLTLPGERIVARVAGERGELAELLEPSPDRVTPPCPHFGACGGCALQHWASTPYLAWKLERVRQMLSHVHLDAPVELAYAAPPGARRRLALHARRVGRTVRIGFKGRRSWDLAPIDTCVIARPGLVAALPALARRPLRIPSQAEIEREFEQALQYRDDQVFHDTLCSLHFQSVEIGNANSRSPKGTVVSWSYNTRPRMNRLPQASASLRKPEKSVAVTVAAALT